MLMTLSVGALIAPVLTGATAIQLGCATSIALITARLTPSQGCGTLLGHSVRLCNLIRAYHCAVNTESGLQNPSRRCKRVMQPRLRVTMRD